MKKINKTTPLYWEGAAKKGSWVIGVNDSQNEGQNDSQNEGQKGIPYALYAIFPTQTI